MLIVLQIFKRGFKYMRKGHFINFPPFRNCFASFWSFECGNPSKLVPSGAHTPPDVETNYQNPHELNKEARSCSASRGSVSSPLYCVLYDGGCRSNHLEMYHIIMLYLKLCMPCSCIPEQ